MKTDPQPPAPWSETRGRIESVIRAAQRQNFVFASLDARLLSAALARCEALEMALEYYANPELFDLHYQGVFEQCQMTKIATDALGVDYFKKGQINE